MAYVDGQTGEGRATSGERWPAAGRNRRLKRRQASQNRDDTPRGVVYEDRWMVGRVQAIPPQNSVTACKKLKIKF